MKRFYTLLLSLLLISTSLFAQKVDYDNDSRWFWGINAGGTWTKTDVPYRLDAGFGLILGRQFNYNYGKIMSFDVRARYLTGLWKGYSKDTTALSSLSDVYSEYKNASKPVFQNFGTKLHEFSLELALHFNTLRERTGWDPYLFGGIGYTFYRVNGDLTDGSGFIYEYDSTKLAGGYSSKEIASISDKKFETNLNGSSFRGAFMPSLGIGIGYQVGKWFSVGIEHKTTFTLADNFDNKIKSTGKFPNDWYHYTSLYLRFNIRGHYSSTNHQQDSVRQPVTNNPTPGSTTNDPTTNPNPPTNTNNPPRLPIVDFTSPNTEEITVSVPSYVIRGRIQYVNSTSNVVFRQNGNYNSAFSFNPSTQDFQSSVTLNPGKNTFELIGSNEFGSDNDVVIINYVKEDRNPPVVTYQNPAMSPETVQNQSYNLTGTVLNVTGRDKISMTLNGQAITNFTYNPSTKGIQATLNLIPGSNLVSTTGVNQYGSDTETATLIYQPRQTVQPPVVYFTNPSVSPYTVNQNTFQLTAGVLHVEDVQHLTFKQNGSLNSNFSFNTSNNTFVSNVVLIPGQNVFELIGTNAAGSASASTVIIYNYVAPKPPVVTITNPFVAPHETTSQTFDLQATVLNVSAKNQIQFQFNGVTTTNFNFNASTNQVSAQLSLNVGANTVKITGTNSDGTDWKQTTILYKRVETPQPPVVNFTTPAVNPYTTNVATMNVVATVLNVTATSGVNVNFNGQNLTNFTFANQTVTFPVNLIEGANAITITGTNAAGTASASQTIIYRKPVAVQPPVVSFIDPAVNPQASISATYQVKARVRFVTSSNQIVLKINGQTTTNFNYTASNEMMEFTAGLANGSNVIEITATNAAGSDSKSTVINYRAPNPVNPPVVTITYPTSNPVTISTNSSNVAATVLNVASQNEINVFVNNQPFSSFTYSTTTKVLQMLASLNVGSNTVRVVASNASGTASDSTTIIVKREQVVLPPTVKFTNPSSPGQIVNTPAFVLKGTTGNITAQNQLVLKHDGQVVTYTYWTFDAGQNAVVYNLNLNEGNNVFELNATNAGGTASTTTTLTYKKPVVECLKPAIVIQQPASNVTVTDSMLNVTCNIIRVSTANQVELYVNGSLQSVGSYNASTSIYNKTVKLNNGSNLIEVRATNECGVTTASATVLYNKIVPPCFPPELTRIVPVSESFTTQQQQVQLSALANNITNKAQLNLTLDGNPVAFTFDAATFTVQANIDLSVGTHTVVLNARNACGTKVLTWELIRTACNKPVFTIVKASASNGATVTFEQMGLAASVTGVSSQSQISVKHNGQAIAFNFSPQTGMMAFDRNMVVGANTFVISITNECGTTIQEITIIRESLPVINPPTIEITNPMFSPLQTDQAALTISGMTTGVTSASQVSVKLNGVNTNFSYQPNGAFTLTANFIEGQNTIVATAVTNGGTASDSKIVIYNKPAELLPPSIQFINPLRCPANFNPGTYTFTGKVLNVTNANQVKITFNGTQIAYQSTIQSNTLSYTFDVVISNTTVAVPYVVTAVTSGGQATKSCVVNVVPTTNNNSSVGTSPSTPADTTNTQPSGANPKLNPTRTPGRIEGGGTNPSTTRPIQTQPSDPRRPVVRP
jgi:hypothetical protein